MKSNLLELAGAALVVVGVALIYPPAAVILSGIALAAIGYVIGGTK